jgi:hypothetical protein
MNSQERYADLFRQGFTKPLPKRRAKPSAEIVACKDCLNWHRKGKHTATPEQRRVNKQARSK